VQGRLRQETLSITVKTECAHCHRTMNLEIDQDLNLQVKDEKCRPVIFVPDVDLHALSEPSIIDSF
jgi:hypothetical protein